MTKESNRHLLIVGFLAFDPGLPVPSAVLDRLSPARREKAARMKLPAAAWRIAAGSTLAEYGLRLLNSEPSNLVYDALGKPVLEPGCGLHVSLSHAGSYVTVLLSPSPCGVDVEKIRPIDVKAGRHIFSEAEMAFIAGLEVDVRLSRFFEIWALKESLAKWQGTGISKTLREGTFILNETGWSLHHPSAVLDAHIIPEDNNYVLAALTAGNELRIERFTVDLVDNHLKMQSLT